MKIEGFSKMLEEIENERGVSKETLRDAIAAALLSAYKKRLHGVEADNIFSTIDDNGVAQITIKKTVVMKVENEIAEISKAAAKKIAPKAKVGSEVILDVTPSDFGRLAAQTAKQVIIQRIREAEKEGAFDEYTKKQGEIINGIVQRREANGYLVNLGRVETLLPFSESIPQEVYRPRDRIKVYIIDIRKHPKGPVVAISRTHPNFLKKLFEIEIPEISQGIIEIKAITREPGRRSKVAVISKDNNIGAVGTCIGHMGNRIQNIVREIGNERVDVVEWSENTKTFITNSLSPAKIVKIMFDQETKEAKVVVPEDQLSLAIGKEGQNVRLAARLTGYKIDIMSEAQAEEAEKTGEKPKAKAKPKEKAEVEEKIEKADSFKLKEIAVEIEKTPKELLKKAKEIGMDVKTSASKINSEEKAKLIKALEETKEESKKDEPKDKGETKE